jgi:outer membrane protein assembly factor BamB
VLHADTPGHWPQWRGPHRDDLAPDTGLLKNWTGQQPRLLWTYEEAGNGYSAPAIVSGRVFTMGATEEVEYVIALDASTGQELWCSYLGPRFKHGYGDGPHATPTIDGDSLYALGCHGDLVCLEQRTGREVWRVHLRDDLHGEIEHGCGYSESPLIDGDLLLCTPGGKEGMFAALDKRTGRVVWRSTELTEAAAYSSIVSGRIDGVKLYVNMTAKGVAAVGADGRLFWRSDEGGNWGGVVATPILHDRHVYVTSGYGAGCALLQLAAAGDKVVLDHVVYANKNLKNHHGGVVLMDGCVYGHSDGRGWVCQDLQTGKVLWDTKRFPKGALTYADGHFYCFSETDGTVALIEASAKEWKECGRLTLPRHVSPDRFFTHPVVTGGLLYLRDQNLIFCFDLRQAKATGPAL